MARNLDAPAWRDQRTIRVISTRSILLCAVPFVALVYLAAFHGCTVPFQDQWHFIPTIAKAFEGTLSIGDLTEPHNEHRIFFPKVMMVSLARATGWNIQAEVWLNVALGVGICATLLYLFQRTMRAHAAVSPWWMAPVIVSLSLSLNQAENWVWGWQCQLLLCVLVSSLGIALLPVERPSLPRFVAALGAGVVASFSFANGLVYWVAALPCVVHVQSRREPGRITLLGVWLAAAVVTAVVYTRGHPSRPKYEFILEHPATFVAYVLSFLGSISSYLMAAIHSQGANVAVSATLGLVVVVGFALLVRAHRGASTHPAALMPHVSLGLFALGSAVMAGLGRVGHVPVAQATTSRYVTIANLIWFSCIALGVMLATTAMWRPRFNRVAAGSLVLLLVLYHAGGLYCAAEYAFRVRFEKAAMEAIRAGSTDTYLCHLVSPGLPELVLEYTPILERHRLCLYRHPQAPALETASRLAAFAREARAEQLISLAAALYGSAVELDPENTGLRHELAATHASQGDWKAAEDSLNAILQSDPDDAVAHANLGAVLGRQEGREDEALMHFERARALNPRDAATYLKESTLRARLGQVELAESLLLEAAAIEPDDRRIQEALEGLRERGR